MRTLIGGLIIAVLLSSLAITSYAEETEKKIYGYYVAVYWKEGPFDSLHSKFFKKWEDAQRYVDVWTQQGIDKIEFVFADIIYEEPQEEVEEDEYTLKDFKNDLFDRIDSVRIFRKD